LKKDDTPFGKTITNGKLNRTITDYLFYGSYTTVEYQTISGVKKEILLESFAQWAKERVPHKRKTTEIYYGIKKKGEKSLFSVEEKIITERSCRVIRYKLSNSIRSPWLTTKKRSAEKMLQTDENFIGSKHFPKRENWMNDSTCEVVEVTLFYGV